MGHPLPRAAIDALWAAGEPERYRRDARHFGNVPSADPLSMRPYLSTRGVHCQTLDSFLEDRIVKTSGNFFALHRTARVRQAGRGNEGDSIEPRGVAPD
ncbi:MAG: hypothetical protein D6812_00920 [Deltaproteobacteria bacterium]|nr:MAG: hypothetical protein D6812_00920 [Deltaproteobacteria bacterium]